MPDIVDLTLCAAARRTLHSALAARGLAFFLDPAGRATARLDDRRIAWIVEAARRGTLREPLPADVDRARRVVRGDLIRLVAERLVAAGL